MNDGLPWRRTIQSQLQCDSLSFVFIVHFDFSPLPRKPYGKIYLATLAISFPCAYTGNISDQEN